MILQKRAIVCCAGVLLAGAPALVAQWPTSPVFIASPLDTPSNHESTCAIDQAGRFAVLFDNWVPEPGDPVSYNPDMTLQFYGENGAAVGGPFALNGIQSYCCAHSGAIAFSRQGNGFAAWHAESEPGQTLVSPYASLLNAEGERTSATFSLQTPESLWPFASYGISISRRGNGTFVAAFRSSGYGPYDDRRYHVVAGSYTAAGSPVAGLFLVSDTVRTGVYGLHPRVGVAALPSGRLAVVWSNLEADGWGNAILLRIFQADGTPVTGEIVVNTYVAGDQLFPDVAADAAGNFVVVWDSAGQDGWGEGVYGQRFDATGAKVGPEFQISSNAQSAQLDADVAMDAAGNFVVAWTSTDEPDGWSWELFGRSYGADGSARGEPVWISEGGPGSYERAQVALSDAGVLVVSAISYHHVDEEDDSSYDAVARQLALPCVPDATTLCLGAGRFLVRAFYDTAIGLTGSAKALPLTAESGGFWFFSPDNFELLVKVLDGCGVNGNYWIYAAGLTDVEVDLIVTDTWTGRVRTYSNVLGTPYAPTQRVSDLATCGAPRPPGAPGPSAGSPAPRPDAVALGTAVTAPCADDATHLCLNRERFRVSAEWDDFAGNQGVGQAVPMGADSGLFWFFGPDNLELGIKVLDGCGVNGRYWVYAAGLTNVGVRLVVEDTATGELWRYENPEGTPFPPVLESSALDVCP